MKPYWLVEYQKLLPNLPVYLKWATQQALSRRAAEQPYIADKDVSILISMVLLKKRRDEIDCLFLLYEEERSEKERYKRLYEEKKAECQELRVSSNRRLNDSFDLGRALGELKSTIEHGRMVWRIFGPLLKERLERKQRVREHTEASLIAHCVNERWWDLLRGSYHSRLPPVRGPARGS